MISPTRLFSSRTTRLALTVTALLAIFTAQGASANIEGVATSSPNAAMYGSISAGGAHTCTVMNIGTVKCWGYNGIGQLGDGTSALDWSSTSSRTPVSALNGAGELTGVTSVSVGANHTCVLLTAGTIKCWGYNSTGQLGDGTTTDRSTAVNVSGITDAIAVSAGDGSTCALLSGGTVKCWGNNTNGELGNGTFTSSNTPVQVNGLTGVVSLTSGQKHSCALLTTGAVKCWGYNLFGQLGDGTTTNRSLAVDVLNLSSVSAISAPSGGKHSCAVLATGAVKCWGLNAQGQVGDGTTTNRSTPVDVVTTIGGTPIIGAVSIATAWTHSCATFSGGTVMCWGDNFFGQLGNGSTTPSRVPVDVTGVSGVIAIASGDAHNCVVFQSTEVKCWGLNDDGRLGDGTTTQRTTAVQVLAAVGGAHFVNVGVTTTTTTSTTVSATTTVVPTTTVTPTTTLASSTTVASSATSVAASTKKASVSTLPRTGSYSCMPTLLGALLITIGCIIIRRRRIID